MSEAAAPSVLPAHAPAAPSRRWLWPVLGLASGLLLVVVTYFCRAELVVLFERPAPKRAPAQAEPVTVLGPSLISIQSGTPLEKRLHIVPVQREHLEYARLNVTGYVMARLAPGNDRAESRWDFASPEVATNYADWLNARKDVLFWEAQAKDTRDLVKTKVEFLKADLDNKEKYFPKGSIPLRDLLLARSDYLQAKIQGSKDSNEVVTTLAKTERNRAQLERLLFQAGVDPEVVRKATDGLVLVVADVPEAKISLVKVGQSCEARFFGDPSRVYQGRVGRLGPSVAKEKRTLRVTFELINPTGRLLPGMFADIGLGTESREVLTVPTEAVLHAGHSDYVLKEESPGQYRAVEVKVDEPRQITHTHDSVSCVPVFEGLHEGERVVSAGSILLKPILVKALANGAASPH